MSSPLPTSILPPPTPYEEMEVANGSEHGGDEPDDGEGDAVMSDDSSEEPEEDAEEERRIREGFIVDEEEEEEEEHDKRKRKRRKHKHRHRRDDSDDGLEEDDLELLAENTGSSYNKQKLSRIRRGRDETPPVSRRNQTAASSDDDLEDIDGGRRVQDLRNIWDDDRGAGQDDDDMDMDDMDAFIDDDDEDGEAMDEEEKERKRRERLKRERERRNLMRSRPELVGIDASAWEEIIEVFGDGHDYDWALEGDDDAPEPMDEEEAITKPDMKYTDVFEPSEIRSRLLTEDDDLIRAQDIPERMQLATSALSLSSTLSLHERLSEGDLTEAANWVLIRLSAQKERDFFRPDGLYFRFLQSLVEAVTVTLRFLFINDFEVPYIWAYKRDYLSYFNAQEVRTRLDLLSLDEVWRIYYLGQKYRSLLERRRALEVAYERIGRADDYYEKQIRPALDTVDIVADTTEWLAMKHPRRKQNAFELNFHDDETEIETHKKKAPSRISAYDLAKRSIVSKLADGYGIQSHDVVINFTLDRKEHFVEDPELNPLAYAEQFADPDPAKAQTADALLRQARMILATELGKDPLLRKDTRLLFRDDATVTVLPTEKGITKINETHPYYNFKYLLNKPISEMKQSHQFLSILVAESEQLVTISVGVPNDAKQRFVGRLEEAFRSDGFSDTARAWNEERTRVVHETVEKHLIPLGEKWVREWLREEVEDNMASHCGELLRERIDVAPFTSPGMEPNILPAVLAVSSGKGDPQKDAITLVFIDEAGRLRDHVKIDNLRDDESRVQFKDLLDRRKPDVVVVGGFSMATAQLSHDLKKVINPAAFAESGMIPQENTQSLDTPVIYVHDDVARIYQHSSRAAEEFSSLSPIARYCVGLARFVQSPLNEFAAMGSDITAITLDEDCQQMLSRERLLTALERVLVDVTCKVGVDINRAVNEPYYQHLLPFICGLGPRKAQALVKKIAAIGGNLVNRDHFIKAGLLSTRIFLNASGFLSIRQDQEAKIHKNRNIADSDAQDPLDSTRIHPEDYELARKMATDALDMDEEDVQDEHASHVVSLIMQDPERQRKLDELNLDDFAINMWEAQQDLKRHTLSLIREELLVPFSDQRPQFRLPTDWEVVTMLSGETERTIRQGLVVSVFVVVVNKTQNITRVRLDSGLEGVIDPNYIVESLNKGQTVPAVILKYKWEGNHDRYTVDLSTRPVDLARDDSIFRRYRMDDFWDHSRQERDNDLLHRRKAAVTNRATRVLDHPNYHTFNSQQAEKYLETQERGDVVIRPSSKGVDHLAITWKVDTGLFQHIDVTDKGAQAAEGMGRYIIAKHGKDQGFYEFVDLDELIVNHIHAMSRRVEELMAHEKFKQGGEDELTLFLKNMLAANPSKSMYGFTMDRRHPGHFSLCFLTGKGSNVQTWPVRVAPEAFFLFETPAPGVSELCDAFKVRVTHEAKNPGGGGKTPYGAGRMTPGRTPGHMTPGRMSVRHAPPARTPNPYGGTTPFRGGGMSEPSFQPPPVAAYGAPYPPPSAHPGFPPNLPPGMNPARAQMIQETGGWGGASGGWGNG